MAWSAIRWWPLLVAAATSGCLTAPAVPGGPLQGVGIQAELSYGYAVAPGEATLTNTQGAVESGSDGAADAVNVPFLPSSFGARFGVAPWADLAGDVGGGASGIEARVGLPEGSKPFPLALAAGYRSTAWALPVNESEWPDGHEFRARLELYPLLTQKVEPRLHLVTSLGASFGPRPHILYLEPPLYEGSPQDAPPFVPNHATLEFAREETRMEASLGVEFRQKLLVASLVALPYVIVHHGEPHGVECLSCKSWTLTDYDQSFGGALLFSFGLSFPFDRAKERRDRTQ